MELTAIIEAFDARAEGSRRLVEVTPQRVVIARRVGGVEMRVALAPSKYLGVALSVLTSEGTDFLYLVQLVHADPALNVTLATCEREDEARTVWRRWSSSLRLARLIEREAGVYEADRTQTQKPVERRRGRATLRRRNRFLARRKMGVAGGAEMVSRGV